MTIDELKQIIQDNYTRTAKIEDQEAYFSGRNRGIFYKPIQPEPDNRKPIPFARKAVFLTKGYMAKPGNIVYSEADYLRDTFNANEESLVDADLLEIALKHGAAYELHWTENNKPMFSPIPAAQAIPIYSNEIKPRMVGFVRTWTHENKTYADYYTDIEIQSFIKEKETWRENGTVRHGYGRVPVVEYKVDRNGCNLYDHVIPLIDTADKILSEDIANELERFAHAYLLLAGDIDDTTEDDNGLTEVDKIKNRKVFKNLGGAVKDMVNYLTKSIDDGFIQNSADRVERLIYEQLNLFNPNDDGFNAASGVAAAYKLLSFEYLCTSIESYFIRGLQDRVRLLTGILRTLSLPVQDENAVSIRMIRNLPFDLAQTADIAVKLKGILSDETILKLFPTYIVSDNELEKLEEQNGMDMEEVAENDAGLGSEPDPNMGSGSEAV